MRPSSASRSRALTAAVFSLLFTGACTGAGGSHPAPDSTESPTLEGDYQRIADWCAEVDAEELAGLLSGATFDQSNLSVGDDPDDAWVRVPDEEEVSGLEVTHCTLNTLRDTSIVVHWYTLVYPTPKDARGAFDTNPPSPPDAAAGAERVEVDGWQQSVLKTYPDPSIEELAAGSMFGHHSNLIFMVEVSNCFVRSEPGPPKTTEACDDDELTELMIEVGEQTQRSLAA